MTESGLSLILPLDSWCKAFPLDFQTVNFLAFAVVFGLQGNLFLIIPALNQISSDKIANLLSRLKYLNEGFLACGLERLH